MTTPDYVPILSAGGHPSPAAGGCFMEIASFLAGEEWSDTPACANDTLASVCRAVNDYCTDEQRQTLADLIPRIIGTGTVFDDVAYPSVVGFMVRWVKGRPANPYINHVPHALYPLTRIIVERDNPREFLTDLFDWWDETFGHEVHEVTDDQWIEVCGVVGR